MRRCSRSADQQISSSISSITNGANSTSPIIGTGAGAGFKPPSYGRTTDAPFGQSATGLVGTQTPAMTTGTTPIGDSNTDTSTSPGAALFRSMTQPLSTVPQTIIGGRGGVIPGWFSAGRNQINVPLQSNGTNAAPPSTSTRDRPTAGGRGGMAPTPFYSAQNPFNGSLADAVDDVMTNNQPLDFGLFPATAEQKKQFEIIIQGLDPQEQHKISQILSVGGHTFHDNKIGWTREAAFGRPDRAAEIDPHIISAIESSGSNPYAARDQLRRALRMFDDGALALRSETGDSYEYAKLKSVPDRELYPPKIPLKRLGLTQAEFDALPQEHQDLYNRMVNVGHPNDDLHYEVYDVYPTFTTMEDYARFRERTQDVIDAGEHDDATKQQFIDGLRMQEMLGSYEAARLSEHTYNPLFPRWT